MIQSFIQNLNNNNFTAFISGGQCYKKYFNKDENTTDFDIHIYITYKQLNDKESFIKIYNSIKNLYKNLQKKYELLPLTKFDYAYFSKKYIEDKLLNKKIEYYNSNIICDLQIEDFDNTYVDISIQVTPDIKKIKENIEDDFYMSKKSFIKQINNFYDALLSADNPDQDKIDKIKNRIIFMQKLNLEI